MRWEAGIRHFARQAPGNVKSRHNDK